MLLNLTSYNLQLLLQLNCNIFMVWIKQNNFLVSLTKIRGFVSGRSCANYFLMPSLYWAPWPVKCSAETFQRSNVAAKIFELFILTYKCCGKRNKSIINFYASHLLNLNGLIKKISHIYKKINYVGLIRLLVK